MRVQWAKIHGDDHWSLTAALERPAQRVLDALDGEVTVSVRLQASADTAPRAVAPRAVTTS